MKKYFRCVALFMVSSLVWISGLSADEIAVTTRQGDEIPIEIMGHSAAVRLLWFPAESGLKEEDRRLARELAQQGVEVWLVDLFAARFLPLSQSSMDAMPGADVHRVIEAATTGGAEVYLFAPGRGAVPVLRGAYGWQKKQGALAGIILLHPKLYEETPEPGEAAHLLPITRLTNQSIYLLQPELSPLRWRLAEMMAALQQGGSDVYIQRLPQVRDRFYFRPDADRPEDRLAQQLPQLLVNAMARLQYVQKHRLLPAGELRRIAASQGKKPRSLRPYTGKAQPPELQLQQYQGAARNLASEQGKVVLVNFWASWCPPCVHEMPSMQALYNTYKPQGLEILAVNMAESETQIGAFLQQVRVDFPILQDRDGAALKRWDVFAFPTSYLVDRHGRIRYALFGAVDWQGSEIGMQITGLLREK